MNEKLKQLAVEIGGSHYPEVSQLYLPLTVRLVYEDAIEALAQAGYEDASAMLGVHYRRTYESLDQ